MIAPTWQSMMHKSSKIIITDTSCFSLLRKLGALELLPSLFAKVITTPEIAAEYKFPLPAWVEVKAVKDETRKQQYLEYIDLGEASAIALASEIEHNYLILDDGDARRFAENLGLKVIGTIGLLIIAKNNGVITSLKHYFDLIQQTNFRISSSILERVLREAGE